MLRIPRRFSLKAMRFMPRERNCTCGSALAHAILTDRRADFPESPEEAIFVGRKILELRSTGRVIWHCWWLARLHSIPSEHPPGCGKHPGRRCDLLRPSLPVGSLRCGSWRWWATISVRNSSACSGTTAWTRRASSGLAGRRFAGRANMSGDMNEARTLGHPTQRLRTILATVTGQLSRQRVRLPGQHRSGFATPRPPATSQGPPGGAGLHELLDQGEAWRS